MPNGLVSQIQVTSGAVYDIKDAWARNKLRTMGKVIEFIGEFPATITPTLAEGDTRTSFKYPDNSDFKVDGVKYVASSGDVFTNGTLELMYDGISETWIEFGSTANLGQLAYYDEATGTVTGAGSVSAPTFTGKKAKFTGSFTGTKVQLAGTIASGATASTTASYTPAGTISKPNVTIDTTGKTTSITPFGSAGTLPSLTTSVSNEVLQFTFSQGTLPSAGTAKTVLTGVAAELDSTPTFTGTAATISGSGAVTGSVTVTATANANGNFTPSGSIAISAADVADSSADFNYQPKGTVSKPTFTGSPVSVTVTGSNS